MGESRFASLTARAVLRPALAVSPHASSQSVLDRFDARGDLPVLAVVEGRERVGVLVRGTLVNTFARRYGRELYAAKPCRLLMDPRPLIVDIESSIEEVSGLLVAAGETVLQTGFVITEHGAYAGVGTGYDVLRELTRLQLAAARYANPLTLLPGNVLIARETERLLARRAPFAVCYGDLNHFKPYNDVYGYGRGDDLIRLTADVLTGATGSESFVGHVGDDDFVCLFECADWERRCERALAEFGRRSPALTGAVPARALGGGRLSGPRPARPEGLSPAGADGHLAVSEAAAEAKKHAKRQPGNRLYVERRRPRALPAGGSIPVP